jgi:mannonate dehydratase
MKLGFGLYKHMLNEEHYKFAKQCGATHLVVHLVDYFSHEKNNKNTASQPLGQKEGWGQAGSGSIWTFEELVNLKHEINSHGLELEAIENFDPAMWYDILLAGEKRDEQLEGIKELIRNVGKAGIPTFGYYFSLAGVASRTEGAYARGGAISVGMEFIDDTPVPNGMIWNMVYDSTAPEGSIPPCSHEELWDRLHYFLQAIIPVAEEAGVTLAAHPDDPPLPFLKQTPRLIYQHHLYQRLIDLYPSNSNQLEYCLGSLSEMTEGDIYESTDQFSKQGKIGYIHFRNVIGKAPNYKEVFVDEGDVDMIRILRILKKNNFNGVLIPDHTPQLSCSASWYAGMAYAMGYMKAALKLI